MNILTNGRTPTHPYSHPHKTLPKTTIQHICEMSRLKVGGANPCGIPNSTETAQGALRATLKEWDPARQRQVGVQEKTPPEAPR